MNGLKYAVLSLAVLACFDGSAKRKNKKAKKAETVRVDTCSVDTFSYAMGMANTQGLKNYVTSRMNVDTAYMANFIEGFNASLSEAERKKLQAYSAGLQIRQQVEGTSHPGHRQTDSRERLREDPQPRPLFGRVRQDASRSANGHEFAKKQRKWPRSKYYHDANMERKYGDNRRAGEAFLKANAKKDSVRTLPSGVQYKVLTQGNGEVPTATSKVKVNYEGRLVDGTVFDSSYERKQPATFGCNQVIKGWTEALTQMPVGSKWEIYIPQELGYGSREAGKIPPFSALIFTVELLEIEK